MEVATHTQSQLWNYKWYHDNLQNTGHNFLSVRFVLIGLWSENEAATFLLSKLCRHPGRSNQVSMTYNFKLTKAWWYLAYGARLSTTQTAGRASGGTGRSTQTAG